jgi:choline-sulfatase
MAQDSANPNFLVIMTDEHGPMFSSAYQHPIVQTPNMERLARDGITFDAAYCNSPLCVPSRISFVTGRYVHHVEGWDNATPLRSDAITWPYLLQARGYDVNLSGKMHLIGPDNLHGFSRQLAVDRSVLVFHEIYPWEEGIEEPPEPWPDIAQAGPGRTDEIDLDDQTEQAALSYLCGSARHDQPFALCVGFVSPHFPLIVPEPYFSRYYPDHTDLPNLPAGHLENLPPAARRLRTAFGLAYPHSEEQLRRARAAYYGLVSYVDDKIGRLRACLEEQGLADNTVIIHTSDHGEMLGEHGLWRKSTFYEQAVRVPLQIVGPTVVRGGRRVREVVSLVDVVATLLDLAGVSTEEQAAWQMDGDSLRAFVRDEQSPWKDQAFAEYTAHGTDRARAMLRAGRWKLVYNHGSPPEFELYDLAEDPGEFTNRAGQDAYREIQESLFRRILREWDPEHINAAVIRSQRARQLIRDTQPGPDLLF